MYINAFPRGNDKIAVCASSEMNHSADEPVTLIRPWLQVYVLIESLLSDGDGTKRNKAARQTLNSIARRQRNQFARNVARARTPESKKNLRKKVYLSQSPLRFHRSIAIALRDISEL